MEIKFNILGITLNRANLREKSIEVISGQKDIDGFLILLSSDDKFSPFNSYDDWIESLEVLKGYLQESN